MKISCEEAGHICTKAQYEEASFWEILKLKIHNLYCRTCAKYSKKNSALTRICNAGNVHVLSEKEKEELKEKLLKNS